jgi:polysaccharide biosynthesis protein PslH
VSTRSWHTTGRVPEMRILFLTQRLPYAPNRGDRVRAYNELRVLSGRHEVHVVSLVHSREEQSHRDDLRGTVASVTTARVSRVRNLVSGAATLPTRRPLTHALLDAPGMAAIVRGVAERHPPGLVLAFCSSMARFAIAPSLGGLPFILDMVDVDSAKWLAMAGGSRGPMRLVYRREARCLGRFEAETARKARVTYVVNAREAASLRTLAGPDARIEVLQNGVDLDGLKLGGPPRASADVVFCGVMDYGPNEEGALWLAREVWPLVLAARPDARLVLLGSSPTARLLRLSRATPSVIVTGAVADVRPWLWKAAVSAAPLLVARGVQNKVMEAVAAGLPVVATPVVAEGLPPEVLAACRTANSPLDFATALLDLLGRTPAERRALAESATLAELGWDRCLEPLLEEVEAVDRRASRDVADDPGTEQRRHR